MALYNREVEDYRQNSGFDVPEVGLEGSVSNFVKDTYKLLFASLIAATAGAYIGMNAISLPTGFSWIGLLVVELGILFGMHAAVKRDAQGLALGLLFAFTFITGLFLGPVLRIYMNGAPGVVSKALLTTTVVFGALTFYALTTKHDYIGWGKSLFIVLIAVIVMSLVNMFFLQSTMLSMAISACTAVLFSFYIIYDTQNIFRGRYESPILACVGMYLNIINLFQSLLHLFGISAFDD